jgi:hypothetical protein
MIHVTRNADFGRYNLFRHRKHISSSVEAITLGTVQSRFLQVSFREMFVIVRDT